MQILIKATGKIPLRPQWRHILSNSWESPSYPLTIIMPWSSCALQNCHRRESTIHSTGFLEMTTSAPRDMYFYFPYSLPNIWHGQKDTRLTAHWEIWSSKQSAANTTGELGQSLSLQSCLERVYKNPKGIVFIQNDIENIWILLNPAPTRQSNDVVGVGVEKQGGTDWGSWEWLEHAAILRSWNTVANTGHNHKRQRAQSSTHTIEHWNAIFFFFLRKMIEKMVSHPSKQNWNFGLQARLCPYALLVILRPARGGEVHRGEERQNERREG